MPLAMPIFLWYLSTVHCLSLIFLCYLLFLFIEMKTDDKKNAHNRILPFAIRDAATLPPHVNTYISIYNILLNSLLGKEERNWNETITIQFLFLLAVNFCGQRLYTIHTHIHLCVHIPFLLKWLMDARKKDAKRSKTEKKKRTNYKRCWKTFMYFKNCIVIIVMTRCRSFNVVFIIALK